MGDEDADGIGSEGTGLGGGGLLELGRRDVDGRDSAGLEVCRVVQTARRAAASIRQGFDHRIALDGDLMAKVDGCRLREGGLLVALDLGPARS